MAHDPVNRSDQTTGCFCGREGASGGSRSKYHRPWNRYLDACVVALLEKGADVNAIEDRVRATAMHYAVGHCQLETIKLMVAYGADVNALDIEGLRPLNYLFANERPEVVAYLRSQGAERTH